MSAQRLLVGRCVSGFFREKGGSCLDQNLRDERLLGLPPTLPLLLPFIMIHPQEDTHVRIRRPTFLLQQVRWLLHKPLTPELHPQFFVGIEFFGEVVGFSEQGHDAEEFRRGDGGVNGVVGEELGDGLDHEELEDAVCDYAVEEAAAGDGDDGRLCLGVDLRGTVVF